MTALLSVREAAAYLGVGFSTLNKLRVTGGGPAFIKIQSRVLYSRSDLDKFIAQHRRKSTAEQKGKAA
jgi:excisionase family DNA binding protein